MPHASVETMRMICPRSLSKSLVAAIALMSSITNAQGEQGAKPKRVIEEVIVAAQKREEVSQDVPISMSVISESFIRDKGLRNAFTFGASLEFADQQAYDTYNNHPDHVRFVNERWLKEVDDFMEIDYQPR